MLLNKCSGLSWDDLYFILYLSKVSIDGIILSVHSEAVMLWRASQASFLFPAAGRCLTMYHRCESIIARVFISVKHFIQYFYILLYYNFKIVYNRLYIITKCNLFHHNSHTILDLLYRFIYYCIYIVVYKDKVQISRKDWYNESC